MDYKGKLFSVLGDSISTFEGYNPPYFPVYYEYERRIFSGVETVSHTWWHRVIAHFGGRLLANNSYSGGCVVRTVEERYRLASGSDPERIELLAKDGVSPDVIMVYLGTNDYGYGTFADDRGGMDLFPYAYEAMLREIRQRFPHAEIWCLNLCRSDRSFGSCAEMARYNRVIAEAAERVGAVTVDLFRHNTPFTTADGVHPDENGMRILAELCIREVQSQKD